ncbi:MAG: T9SS type A sorting domain-containing protein [Prevotellaceae bacterium]|nr:T9SS type A sorting domain-containing protein [Prevotellaceae bacterium]
MRNFLFLLSAIPVHLFASGNLYLWNSDGEKRVFELSTKPTVTYTEENIVFKTTDTELLFPVSDCLRFSFNDDDELTGINDIVRPATVPRIFLGDRTLSVSTCEPNSTIDLYTIEGKIVMQGRTDSNGSWSSELTGLNAGVYVVKTKNISFKFIIRQ